MNLKKFDGFHNSILLLGAISIHVSIDLEHLFLFMLKTHHIYRQYRANLYAPNRHCRSSSMSSKSEAPDRHCDCDVELTINNVKQTCRHLTMLHYQLKVRHYVIIKKHIFL